ncbi:MAG: amylosucrase [Trueperaceae bacterium]
MQNQRFFDPQTAYYFKVANKALDTVLVPMIEPDWSIFKLRLERHFQNLLDALEVLYGGRKDFESVITRLVVQMAETYSQRDESLKVLDLERDLTPDWFQRENMMGYVFYVERFAETIRGIEKHIDYLEELGVSYVHLMSLIRPREGESDGGFAVLDYKDVDPKLGSMDDLEQLCSSFRERGISVCVDLVLNHCAKDHEWAMRAKAGEKKYQDYFYMFPDRIMPDAYEKTLPEIFPDFKSGNFVYYEDLKQWVWVTFNEFQWDLNWTNPEIFLEIADILLYLANKGVEVFRLDAVAFMWKRLGTNCQNQPEVFAILQALRAVSNIATPSVIHKAEAIVAPDELIKYFGLKEHHGKVSHLAYHNVFMVQYWSSLASRDTRLMTHVMREFPSAPSNTAWTTYIRCHDDIGWAITDEDARDVGLEGFLHRKFLSDFYSGEFETTFAKGDVFQFNPATGDRRISGSFASLAGLEQALEKNDPHLIGLAVQRILMGHALMCGFAGVPLLYMGDELGMLNDYSYKNVPEHAADNRWLHRPRMDWKEATKRNKEGAIEERIFTGVKNIIKARKRTSQLHAGIRSDILDTGHPHVFAYVRKHPLGNLLCLYNFTEGVQWFRSYWLYDQGIFSVYDTLGETFIIVVDDHITLQPYQGLWLVNKP